MYEIEKHAYEPDNFHAGSFPVKTQAEDIKTSAVIHKYAPVVRGNDGIEEATAATLDKLVGIAADEAHGGQVVFHKTGNFFASALHLPTGVTLKALKLACEKLNIYLK